MFQAEQKLLNLLINFTKTMLMKRTIPDLVEQSVEKYPNNVLVWEKTSTKYEGITYQEIHERVYNCANYLHCNEL